MLDGIERQSASSIRRIVAEVTRGPTVGNFVQRDCKQQRNRAKQNPLNIERRHRRSIRGSKRACGQLLVQELDVPLAFSRNNDLPIREVQNRRRLESARATVNDSID